MKRRVLSLLFLLAASTTPPAPPPGSVMVAPGTLFALPAPAALGREIEAVQLVTARHGKDEFTFEGHLSVTKDRVLLAGTDGFGQRLMEIAWDGKTLTAHKASFLPDSLPPENVLADVMLIYWPGAAAGIDQDKIVIERDPDPWRGQARLTNRAWDYEIDVRSSVVAP
jgi:hypothetical protein